MLQKMNHEMDFADVLQWVQLACDAPFLEDELRRARVRSNMLRL